MILVFLGRGSPGRCTRYFSSVHQNTDREIVSSERKTESGECSDPHALVSPARKFTKLPVTASVLVYYSDTEDREADVGALVPVLV